MSEAREIKEQTGKLGVLMPGMGAVATTFVAGVELIKKGHAEPVARSPNSAPYVSESAPRTGCRR